MNKLMTKEEWIVHYREFRIEANKIEYWNDVKDYVGIYRVSNLGRMMSLNYRNSGKSKVLNIRKDTNGYPIASLQKKGKRVDTKLHRVVAKSFISNPENKLCINHIDESQDNNNILNLEWVSHKENCNHGTRNQRMRDALSVAVLQCDMEGNVVKRWKSMKSAETEGFHHTSISRCCRGIYSHHKGHTWRLG